VLSFLSNENCFAGHGLSITAVHQNFEVISSGPTPSVFAFHLVFFLWPSSVFL